MGNPPARRYTRPVSARSPYPVLKRVPVWSGRLRLAHWVLAAGVTGAWVTGALLDHSADLYQAALDLHYLFGYAMLLALLLRLGLLVAGRGPERLAALLPTGERRAAAWAVARFYLRLGRGRLPRWYAHNPLWGPLYLAMLVLMALLAVTGLVPDAPLAGAGLHETAARILAVLAIAHVVAVVLQDLRGDGADVSAMIGGYRLFTVEPVEPEVAVAERIELRPPGPRHRD